MSPLLTVSLSLLASKRRISRTRVRPPSSRRRLRDRAALGWRTERLAQSLGWTAQRWKYHQLRKRVFSGAFRRGRLSGKSRLRAQWRLQVFSDVLKRVDWICQLPPGSRLDAVPNAGRLCPKRHEHAAHVFVGAQRLSR